LVFQNLGPKKLVIPLGIFGEASVVAREGQAITGNYLEKLWVRISRLKNKNKKILLIY